MFEQLVSVIVPVYNVEAYLGDCISGILNQTYRNLEILIIDDGSTDSSGVICDRICELDSRIKIIHQENQGLSAARNTGINASNGEYLCFVDSDDMVNCYMIEHLMLLIQKYNADLAHCRSVKCDIKTKYVDLRSENKDIEGVVTFTTNAAMEALLRYRSLPVTAWGKIYNRQIFNKLRFPTGKYNEDAFISFLVIENSKIVCGCENVYYYYRINPKSIMRSTFEERRFDGIEAKLKQLSFVNEKYPWLIRYAESAIIAVCNECVFDMGVSNYSNTDKEEEIRKHYKKYLSSYLRDSTSLKGKIFAIISCLSISFGKKVARKLSKYKPMR